METPLLQEHTTPTLPRQFLAESKKLWKIAGPVIFTAICQYSLSASTQAFIGHVGNLELAAFAVTNSVIAGLAFGILFTHPLHWTLGMGSALETLCGQAFGAGKLRMLGVYMQRSWIILLCTALILVPVYVFAPPILKLMGETSEISDLAGKFSIWMLPQLFAYAVNFPIQKYLQAQRKVMTMAVVAAVVLVINVVASWLLILKLEWGLVGAAVSLNSSFWLLNFGQMAYIWSGTCGEAWSGFSWLAFTDLYQFLKLSIASAVMLCLEYWYLMLLIVLTGRLKNPLIPVDAISVCVRVSNELGTGNSQAAKFSVMVVSITSVSIGLIIMALALITRDQFPLLFTSSIDVAKLVTKLTGLLAVSLVLNSLQPVLSGRLDKPKFLVLSNAKTKCKRERVAIGAGWQALVAYINVACYYLFGLPAGLILGFKLKLGVEVKY
ncbi:hypothetical protein ACLOJK_002917 [Asimina triloba]